MSEVSSKVERLREILNPKAQAPETPAPLESPEPSMNVENLESAQPEQVTLSKEVDPRPKRLVGMRTGDILLLLHDGFFDDDLEVKKWLAQKRIVNADGTTRLPELKFL